MGFFNRFIKFTSIITTFTLICFCIWNTAHVMLDGKVLNQAVIYMLEIWQPLPVGILTGLVSAVFFHGREMSRKEFVIRVISHYVCVNAIVLTCGYMFGWYVLSVLQVTLMLITTLIVYIVVYTLTYLNDQKTAKRINQKLEEMN